MGGLINLLEADAEARAWQNYMAETAWLVATHQYAAADRFPRFRDTIQHDDAPAKPQDTRTTKEIMQGVLSKLSRFTGDDTL